MFLYERRYVDYMQNILIHDFAVSQIRNFLAYCNRLINIYHGHQLYLKRSDGILHKIQIPIAVWLFEKKSIKGVHISL